MGTDITDLFLFRFLHDNLRIPEDVLYQLSVLLHLMAQPLCVIMVDLDIPVKSLHFRVSVECIVGIGCPVVF